MTDEQNAETVQEEAKEVKPVVYEGAAAGKYNWTAADKSGQDADKDIQGAAINKYSWSDGKKQVSIYIELDGLDQVADDALTTDSGETNVSMDISNLDGKKRSFVMKNLANEITGVKLQRKIGKNTVVLKLQKKEEAPWYSLQEGKAGAGDDDDAGGMGGGMGGMGGGMGGMGGGMPMGGGMGGGMPMGGGMGGGMPMGGMGGGMPMGGMGQPGMMPQGMGQPGMGQPGMMPNMGMGMPPRPF